MGICFKIGCIDTIDDNFNIFCTIYKMYKDCFSYIHEKKLKTIPVKYRTDKQTKTTHQS